MASLLIFISCSEETKYKVLNFFFDGVPDPNAKVVQVDSVKIDSSRIKRRMMIVKQAALQVFFHEPFKERLCEECHNLKKGNELLLPLPNLCFKCHDDFLEEAEFRHGPAAAGYCTECHHPHMEKEKFMLKRAGQELCLYCHNIESVQKNDVHVDIEDTKCWECHDPHASDEEYLLN